MDSLVLKIVAEVTNSPSHEIDLYPKSAIF